MTNTRRGQPSTSAQPGRRPRFFSDTGQLLVAAILITGSAAAAAVSGNGYLVHTFELVNILVAAAVFQNFLMDDAGQVSFGQGAVLGAAAYCAAVVTGVNGYGIATGAIAGVIAALCVGLLTALPALRVQGYYLGFVTLSAALVFPELLLYFDRYTNGIVGIPFAVPWLTEASYAGIPLPTALCAALAVGAVLLHTLVRRTRFGRGLRVSAASPEAARSLGISPELMRSAAFALSALGTGVAGIMFLPAVGFVGPTTFSLDLSIMIFFAVVVGGQGHILSPVIGVWLMYIVPNVLLVDFVQYRLFVYGALTLVIMVLFPSGLVGSLVEAARKRVAAPSNLRLGELLARSGHGSRAVADRRPDQEAAIVVQGVCKSFGKVVALTNVNLEVRRGEVHALVGLNGSGKTTLLNMLCGFGRPDAGGITINGRDVSRMAAHKIARCGVGRTFQTPRIFPGLSLWENVQVGADARQTKANSNPALTDTLARSWGEHDVTGVSHGQRRLLEVLRNLLSERDILLLDEPAAGLSPDERQEFAAMIRALSTVRDHTLVIVEHDLELVWSVADRISVMKEGRVVASGRPQDIIDHPAADGLFVE